MYKYTFVTPVLRGVISRFFQQSGTVSGVIGATLRHHEGLESSNLLHTKGI